jgi:NADPH2:quinone reductase
MSPGTMRAATVDEFGPPQNLRITSRPVPEPGSDEISIDVAFAGVGFVDTLFRAGAFPMPTPLVPGIEVTGRVRAVGPGAVSPGAVSPGAGGFVPGQLVGALLNDFGRGSRTGGYAEVAIAHRAMAAPVPDGADLPRVTAVIANGVAAWIALHDLARLSTDDRVLVLGASGGLGATTARLAALHPAARVIGVVGHDPGRAPGECTDVLLAADLDHQLPRLTEDGLVDVVVDPVGGPQRTTAFGHLAPFGRHLVLGNASGDDQPFSGDQTWLGSRVVAGLSVGGVAHLRPAAVTRALTAVITLVARGTLSEPRPAIEPLEHAAAVHQAIADRRAPAKTVLSVAP